MSGIFSSDFRDPKKNYRLEDRLMAQSGTVGGRASRNRSEYARMDQQIEGMIQDNRLASLVDFARDNSIRVGDMLGNYGTVLAQWEISEPELLRRLLTLTWNRLDDETRKKYMHLMLRMIHRVSKSEIAKKGRPSGEVCVAPFDSQGDEIELDRTAESLVECPYLSYDNLFVLDRKRRKKAVILMMDASGSMQGEKLSMAATAVASLAINLDYGDEYGLVIFSDKARIMKRIDQAMSVDRVIREVLNVLPEGRTDLSLGLSAGLHEIERSRVEQRIGILATDGWQNLGHDPAGLAARFPRLNVIGFPGGSSEHSEKMARAGRGRLVLASDMLDVPKAIRMVLD